MPSLRKALSAIAIAATTALLPAPTAAWWDLGHMLVGKVASQLMTPEDVGTIERVLGAWKNDFPNTDKIYTAAIWPDLIKCKGNSTSCKTPLLPSFSAMDKWHFVNLPLFANGAAWGNSPPDVGLFKESFGGDAVDVLDKFFATFVTTKSTWTANLALRQLIHIVGC